MHTLSLVHTSLATAVMTYNHNREHKCKCTAVHLPCGRPVFTSRGHAGRTEKKILMRHFYCGANTYKWPVALRRIWIDLYALHMVPTTKEKVVLCLQRVFRLHARTPLYEAMIKRMHACSRRDFWSCHRYDCCNIRPYISLPSLYSARVALTNFPVTAQVVHYERTCTVLDLILFEQ